MKIEFNESKFASWIDLVPETPEEVAKLLRMTANSKRESPQIYTSFSNDVINSQIYIAKLDESKQNNSINNNKKIK